MHEHLRDRLLARWGRFATTRPWLTLLVCLVLAALGIGLAATQLRMRTDRSELVDSSLEWNARYATYKAQFPRWNDVIVVVEGDAADARVTEFTRALADHLRALLFISIADAGFDTAEAGPRFFYAASDELFDQTLRDLATARAFAHAENPNTALALLLSQLQSGEGDPSDLDRLEQFLKPYVDAAEGGEPDFSFMDPRQSRWQPFASRNGTGPLRFIRVHFSGMGEGLEGLAADVKRLREAVRAYEAAHPPGAALSWGVTGIPALEADETAQSVRDSTLASIIAAVMIAGMMIAVYRGIWVPLLAMASLLIGLAWSFGWIVISVGHLQVLSVTFCSILMGLGIDYALLLISRLELLKERHPQLDDAMERAFRRVGPGMITGAITTAAAFASTAFTQFTGMAEMGIIAGGGIILCVVAVMCSLPAMLAVTGGWRRLLRSRPGGEDAHFAHGWFDVFDRRPWATVAMTSAITIGFLLLSLRVHYDGNVLRLQAPGVESVRWEHRIVEDDARTTWHALAMTTPEEGAALAARYRALTAQVSEVGGAGLLVPPKLDERLGKVRAVAATAPPRVVEATADLGTTLSQLNTLRAGIGLQTLTRRVPEEIKTRLQGIASRVGEAVTAGTALDDQQRAEAWRRLDGAWVRVRESLASFLATALDGNPPSEADLPPTLRDQFIGRDGSWLLMIFPTPDPEGLDRSILDPARLENFVTTLQATDPHVFGPPIQIHESSRVILRAYGIAAAIAVGSILVLLLLDFRRISDAICCLLPVFIGFLGAFGMMGLFGVPLNFANLIVMPLIFGLGMDASVNIVHRWRQHPVGRPAGLSGGTGRGITLALVSTMIGFGALLVSDHRGIQSLGFAVLAGLGVTLAACYSILPAVLRLRTRPAQPPLEPDDD
jgi:uncharacterized protein